MATSSQHDPIVSLPHSDTPHATLERIPVAFAAGDGIGPEIAEAVRRILEAAQVPLELEPVTLGERAYLGGVSTGVPDDAWAAIRRSRALLKGPITTPQGGGYKSVNVTLRKTLGLFANVRPCESFACLPASAQGIDLVVVRENEEDLYAGIEHRQTPETYQCLKLVTRAGCERIVRYAFAFARANGRSKVTCMTKDNIMKLTDGLFHRVFDEVAREYPELGTEHQIIDIGAARLATRPQAYDVIVTLNLYGDILSDIAAEVSGSVGLGGSANIGRRFAMFEAVHGSAPDIAGRDIANPSGLLQSAVALLVHVGLGSHAATLRNAWLRTLEQGIHTADLRPGRPVGTLAFADAVIANLGALPERLKVASFPENSRPIEVEVSQPAPQLRERSGIDVFVHHTGSVDTLAAQLLAAAGPALQLTMITNRGVKVWPAGHADTLCTDHWRCRFVARDKGAVEFAALHALVGRIAEQGGDVIKTEGLFQYDGQPGFSAGQGA
ncbi:MAG: NADP-dependent isocitrate dehydrogenase [Planctomycetota bacterium]|nr:NADP-dependent isocitrate dehydrogenase [Planctomycetota bacterium]